MSEIDLSWASIKGGEKLKTNTKGDNSYNCILQFKYESRANNKIFYYCDAEQEKVVRMPNKIFFFPLTRKEL